MPRYHLCVKFFGLFVCPARVSSQVYMNFEWPSEKTHPRQTWMVPPVHLLHGFSLTPLFQKTFKRTWPKAGVSQVTTPPPFQTHAHVWENTHLLCLLGLLSVAMVTRWGRQLPGSADTCCIIYLCNACIATVIRLHSKKYVQRCLLWLVTSYPI